MFIDVPTQNHGDFISHMARIQISLNENYDKVKPLKSIKIYPSTSTLLEL